MSLIYPFDPVSSRRRFREEHHNKKNAKTYMDAAAESSAISGILGLDCFYQGEHVPPSSEGFSIQIIATKPDK